MNTFILIVGIAGFCCVFAPNARSRKAIALAALCFVLLAAAFGCAADGRVPIVGDVAVAAPPAVRDTPIAPPAVTGTVPAERDTLRELLAAKASLAEAMAGHKEIAAQRQQLAEAEARVRAELTATAAEKDAALARLAAETKAGLDRDAAAAQAKINRDKADTDAANQRAAEKAKQERQDAEDAAAMARNMAYSLFAVGAAGMLAGAAVFYFMKQHRLGIFIAVAGLGLVLLASNLVALALPVKLAVIGGLVVALVFGIGNVASSLYWDWRTRAQAFNQQKSAMEFLAAGDTKSAAIMDASARTLARVSSPDYDPSIVGVANNSLAILDKEKP